MRLNNDYYGLMKLEATAGTQIKDLASATVMPCTIDIKPVVMTQETGEKTLSLEPKVTEKLKTGEAVTVNIKGAFAKEYSILLQAATHDSSSPLTFQASQPAGFSYSIYRYWSKGTAAYDGAFGCKLKTITFTADSNGLINFDANFDGWSMLRATANSAPNALSNVPANASVAKFRFADMTATLYNSATKMNSFSFGLENIYEGDNIAFQNSPTKTGAYLIGQKGTLSFQTIYDDAADPAFEAAINNGTAYLNTFSFINGGSSFVFTTYSAVTDFALPDTGKGLCLVDHSLELAGDSTHTALSIAVTIA